MIYHCKNLLCLICILGIAMSFSPSVLASSQVAYLDPLSQITLVENEFAYDAQSSLAALGSPTEDSAGLRLDTAIPKGTKLLDMQADGETITVVFSKELIGAGLSEDRLDTIQAQVRATLHQFSLDRDVHIFVEDKPIEAYTGTLVWMSNNQTSNDQLSILKSKPIRALSGHSMTLSPGHGTYWTGSKWDTQRGVNSAPLDEEDYHTLEMCEYLKTYLECDGMLVKDVRCMDMNYGKNQPTGREWWQMAACYWLQKEGYPGSVYGSYGAKMGGGDQNDLTNDVRCRGLASNYDGTEIYLSFHTNGLNGDTYSNQPTGTEIYYDNGTTHAPWGEESKRLATDIYNSVMPAILDNYDPTWTSHGAPIKDAQGRYGETRLPEKPAALLELAFHDTCLRDGKYLQDNFFRTVSMWAIYKGICDYYHVIPTWDMYSCEYVSDTIPTKMKAGKTYVVGITLKNHGVLWTENKQIRLGEVGGDKLFTPKTRQTVVGEVGPNETYTFWSTMTAPKKPGIYGTDWRMLREGKLWFGPTVYKKIKVVNAPRHNAVRKKSK